MECELGEVIAGAVRIVQATTNSANSETIQILFPEDRFRATVQFHPSVLRQVFVDLLSEMLHIRGIRQLHFAGQSSTNRYKVLMTASPATGAEVLDFPTANELLIYQGGGIEIRHLEDALTIEVDLPLGKASQPVHVLVVDDNLDLVNLYQSYCAGTPFQIHHVREGGKVFESIRALHPDIIMLDILLPDVNGLDLLLNLHANPETRSIPIIICSVIVDERLVHDLGAALFLRKPVWKQQLLTSLEQALSGSPKGFWLTRAKH
jgi:CheY-like chemotaxis protein